MPTDERPGADAPGAGAVLSLSTMRRRLRRMQRRDNAEGMERAVRAWLKRDAVTAQNARIAAEELEMEQWIDLDST